MPVERERRLLPTSSINVHDIRAALAADSDEPPAEPLIAPGVISLDAITAAVAAADDGTTPDPGQPPTGGPSPAATEEN